MNNIYDSKKNDKKNSKQDEKKSNIIFIITVLIFLICVIIAKVNYEKMQEQEARKLSTAKWYASDEKTVKELGYLQVEFRGDSTFDIYYSDTQISCMSGEYIIGFAGRVKLECDNSGFNPPKKWNCKEKSWFKYKIRNNKLYMTYKGITATFEMKGESAEEKNEEVKKTDMHNMYFKNEQAKMLVSFYNGDMYIYNLNSDKKVFGDQGEVLGDICLFGAYTQDDKKARINVLTEHEGDVKDNPMWPQMKELGEYEFKYRVEGEFEKLVLQYEDKAYEFVRVQN